MNQTGLSWTRSVQAAWASDGSDVNIEPKRTTERPRVV